MIPNDSKNPEQDSSNYIWGIFYCNPKDDRIFPPKKNPLYGITLNFGHPKAYLALFLMLAFFGFILYMIERNQSQLIVK